MDSVTIAGVGAALVVAATWSVAYLLVRQWWQGSRQRRRWQRPRFGPDRPARRWTWRGMQPSPLSGLLGSLASGGGAWLGGRARLVQVRTVYDASTADRLRSRVAWLWSPVGLMGTLIGTMVLLMLALTFAGFS